jgi:hypothetical protein
VREAPQSSEKFADAMREFCEDVLAGKVKERRRTPDT